MISLVENGNLFDSQMQTIVNPINIVSTMGKGLALEFKKRYPEYYQGYKKCCDDNLLKTGCVYIHRKTTPWILSFPTKEHWRNPSKIEYIIDGLDFFVQHYQEKGITSIAFPALGCQNGGLDWEEVKAIMLEKLGDLPIDIEIYAPLNK